MTKSSKALGLSVFVLGSAIGMTGISSAAQAQSPDTSVPAAQSSQASGPATAATANDKSSYATGKPLEMQSKEGFWGHMNPLARKKWVNRQTAPLRDRANELDQLQSKNANDIRDVDSRSQAGIKNALNAATTADQHAQDAATRASAANQLAGNASDRTTSLNGTVANLDQYEPVTAISVPFAAGRTALGKTAKTNLDDVATKLEGEKGYIIEVQGYSRSGVQASQAMADSVVRYLVTEHQVPVYRIYRTGLGKNTAKTAADGEKVIVNGVRVTLLHNSLATMGSTTATNSTAPKTSSTTTGTSAPTTNQ